MKTTSILKINSSSRLQGSVTRQISELLTTHLLNDQPDNNESDPSETNRITDRDLAHGLPFIDENWIGANFTAPEDRTSEHQEVLSLSNHLVEELKAADTIVIGAPIYNFNIPAALKAWIDLIARARLTFKYGENGPVGLLKNKKAYIVMASGGVPIGSAMDFASGYLQHVLAFVGITDVTIIDASQFDLDKEPNEIAQQLTELVSIETKS